MFVVFPFSRSFFGLSYSPVTRTIVTASADRAIRLYDPRSKDGVIVKSQYTSHQGWVTCVDWSRKGSEVSEKRKRNQVDFARLRVELKKGKGKEYVFTDIESRIYLIL